MVAGDPDFASVVSAFAPALRRLQQVTGVSSELLIRRVAETLGLEFARAMTSNSLDQLLEELGLLFDSLHLGRITVSGNGSEVDLTIDECLGCEQVPDASDSPNCALREGILKTIFDERLGLNSSVKLRSSRGSEFGAKTCQFNVKIGGAP